MQVKRFESARKAVTAILSVTSVCGIFACASSDKQHAVYFAMGAIMLVIVLQSLTILEDKSKENKSGREDR